MPPTSVPTVGIAGLLALVRLVEGAGWGKRGTAGLA